MPKKLKGGTLRDSLTSIVAKYRKNWRGGLRQKIQRGPFCNIEKQETLYPEFGISECVKSGTGLPLSKGTPSLFKGIMYIAKGTLPNPKFENVISELSKRYNRTLKIGPCGAHYHFCLWLSS